jgi:hypothetical protein
LPQGKFGGGGGGGRAASYLKSCNGFQRYAEVLQDLISNHSMPDLSLI